MGGGLNFPAWNRTISVPNVVNPMRGGNQAKHTTAPTAVQRWMVMGMVVDIGEVKRHIKPKADSTLHNMKKDDLVKYIRTLEHNYNVAVSFNENQAKYIESLGITEVVRCKKCMWARPKDHREPTDTPRELICQCPKHHYIPAPWHARMAVKPDDFCSYGEIRESTNV